MAVVKPFRFNPRSETWKLLTRKKWNSFYIDPPHRFSNMRTGGNMASGASQKYETLKLKAICDQIRMDTQFLMHGDSNSKANYIG